MTDRPAFVLLEDGAWFPGTSARPIDPAFGEVVFTTNLTGYQETFTDPSYLGQIVVMTAPMIGNYGVNTDDMESGRPQVTGVVVRELSRHPSNWRSTRSLDDSGPRGHRYPAPHPASPRARRHARGRGRGAPAQSGAHVPAAGLALDGRARSGIAGHGPGVVVGR
jgi:carbamoyl-phosphate synthase small subunit